MVTYCCGFAFPAHTTEEVLLIKKVRPAWQAGKLNGIGGHNLDKELPLSAMRREFYEETGLSFNEWRKFCTVTDGHTFEVHFFTTWNAAVKHAKSMTEEKVGLYKWADPQVQNLMIPNLKWLIPMALDIKVGSAHITWHR